MFNRVFNRVHYTLGRNSIAVPSFRIILRIILRIAIELNQFREWFWEWFWDWNLGHTAERTCTNYQFENHSQTEHFGMILRIILRSLVVNSIAILRMILRIILKLRIAIELHSSFTYQRRRRSHSCGSSSAKSTMQGTIVGWQRVQIRTNFSHTCSDPPPRLNYHRFLVNNIKIQEIQIFKSMLLFLAQRASASG